MSEQVRCGARCWFAYYGMVGTSRPECARCGRPNPRYESWRDPFAVMEEK